MCYLSNVTLFSISHINVLRIMGGLIKIAEAGLLYHGRDSYNYVVVGHQ
jgi:hypothetical protein